MLRTFIDAHVHLNTTSRAKMDLALERGAYFLSVNTDIPFFESVEKQGQVILELQRAYPGRVQHVTSFDTQHWGDTRWATHAIDQIKRGLDQGAVGVKIWKNIGMDSNLRHADGSFMMIDDPVLTPILEFLAEQDILLIGHQGEPRNCWLPLPEMTVDSDRNYFAAHPEYHMYLHPAYPSYEAQIQARDRILQNYPTLRFVGLHLLSLEWNLAEVDRRLEQFPNLLTDLAERICHVQLQAMHDREAVRDFFIKHQDRIIYGTDVIDDGSLSDVALCAKFEHLWDEHWRFFATAEPITAPEFQGTFTGLALPETVLRKIFLENAARTYGFDLIKT